MCFKIITKQNSNAFYERNWIGFYPNYAPVIVLDKMPNLSRSGLQECDWWTTFQANVRGHLSGNAIIEFKYNHAGKTQSIDAGLINAALRRVFLAMTTTPAGRDVSDN